LGVGAWLKVAINYNWYPTADDRQVYELHTAPRNMETQTYPQHILSSDEWLRIWNHLRPSILDQAITMTHVIAEQCEHFELPKAEMVRYKGRLTLRGLCRAGARKHDIDIEHGEYADRLERELASIESHGYEDYFLVVADLIRKSKRNMLVGPSRGSSAGSLVCYLAGITEVDPIRFGLMFERFIDDTRKDLPDIDIDFPDGKRDLVIKTLIETYSKEHVSHIATIATMKPKSAIGEFAAGLMVPKYETEALKDSVIQRSGGDARAALRITDTFTETDVGREFLKDHPMMALTERIEGHARHAGVHAAGMIVCNEPLTNYAGVNCRSGVVMLDKKEAEALGLLKIDCLGLRTLSVLENVADQIGMPYADYYKLPLDDQATFDIFNDMRLDGIFQFQGQALQYVTRQMGVKSFDDIAAITALARPGPIHSGGTNIFISRKTGEKPVEFLSRHPSVVAQTENTYGVIIYQEQLMAIGREYGELSWEDVQQLRVAASKSLGEEFFGKYKDNFVNGALKKGADQAEAVNVWENMVTFGSWGFNKSHAYSYALISYWTAWAKAHHPLEFATANLNNARSEMTALRILRDMVRNDGIEYEAFDPEHSQMSWSIKDGKLLGGLLTIKGIGKKKASAILQARKRQTKWTPSMIKLIKDPHTIFTILFPCQHYWGDLFDTPSEVGLEEPPVHIETIEKPGSYLFVGKLLDKNLRDLNEYQSLVKRGGQVITDHTKFLNLILEDDTDSIVCTVNRYRYEALGRDIVETGREDKDWFLVRGKIRDKWRRIDVEQVLNLTRWRAESETPAS
jgi:DNA-directed DNA polymerase III PolC